MGPSKIRPNSDYHVSASIHDPFQPVQINITISGQLDQVPFNSVSKNVIINHNETRIINFEIGEWTSGNYKLKVEGDDGNDTFSNETELQFEKKTYSVFIQTDKAIYKPGQLVQFRIIVVNPFLLPIVTGALDIHIKV